MANLKKERKVLLICANCATEYLNDKGDCPHCSMPLNQYPVCPDHKNKKIRQTDKEGNLFYHEELKLNLMRVKSSPEDMLVRC